MGYKWSYLRDYDYTDHTTQIFGLRIKVVDGSILTNNIAAFTEKRGYDANFERWCAEGDGTSEAEGYYTYHRFNTGYWKEFYNRRNLWNNMDSIVIEGDNWKEGTGSTFGFPLYFAGINSLDAFNRCKEYYQFLTFIPFEPSKSVFNFRSTGGTDTFTLEADSNWTATTSSSWVHLNQTTGTTGGTITLTCDANSGTARTATYTFTNEGGDTFNLTINQKAQGIMVPQKKMKKSGRTIAKEYYNGVNN